MIWVPCYMFKIAVFYISLYWDMKFDIKSKKKLKFCLFLLIP